MGPKVEAACRLVEGRDVMPIGNGAVMIGIGERTAPPAPACDEPRPSR